MFGNQKGTSFIELLVTFALIGIIGVTLMADLVSAIDNGRVAKAQDDLTSIAHAIDFLVNETGEYPSHKYSACWAGGGNEITIDECRAGLYCNDGFFYGWGGPYLTQVPRDPWGNIYYFDHDYQCLGDQIGCEHVPEGNEYWVGALLSKGPNGKAEYNGDDIIFMFCWWEPY